MNVTRTIAATLLGAATLAVVILPGERRSSEPVLNPLRQDLAAAANTLSIREAMALRLMARAFVLTTVAKEDRTVTVRVAPGLGEPDRQFYDSVANAYVASLGVPVDSSMRLVITVARDTASAASLSRFASWKNVGPQVFLPGTIRPNECHVFVGETYDPKFPKNVTRHSPSWRFEACRPYLLYGTPGRGTDAWLASLNYSPLFAFLPEFGDIGDDVASWRVFNRSSEGRRVRSCRSGRAEACEALLLWIPDDDRFMTRNERRANSFTGRIGKSQMYAYGSTQLVLSSVQRQLGPDAIRTLWRSDSSFAVSLAMLTGQPVATTVRSTLDEVFRKAPADVRQFRALGPLPRLGSITLLFAIVIALFITAGIAVRRNGFTS